MQGREHEVFSMLFLDNQHRILAYEEIFRGSLCSTIIYPREIVKCRLSYICSANIAAHNNPSGNPAPSLSDKSFTEVLKDTLSLGDIHLLDHLIVGTEGVCVTGSM
nr:JAB domain-containing protein [Aeromonas popoffii]